MRYSHLFGKTSKTAPADADSVNARLLAQAGFVDRLMAGVYSYLPLGLRVLNKIERIVREEMDALGAQELLLPALHPKEPWEQTGRWRDPGTTVMFQLTGRGDKAYGLGWTHEEIITPLAKRFIRSYRDLPFAVYQMQDKFRDEPRPKSGLLRGREFWMKDMYSFHADEGDLDAFHERVQGAYERVFRRCGLTALLTEASGGAFSQFSHEFQVLTEYGEDTIFFCERCRSAQNREIATLRTDQPCPKCGGSVREGRAIEVGNIFRLQTRFTDAFGVTFLADDGARKPVRMGCYGLGPTRVMGAIVEVHHDVRGIIWPVSVAPFRVHTVPLPSKDATMTARIAKTVDALERNLAAAGCDTLVDDRDARPGEKFADADLIGCPVRIVISEKTLAQNRVEYKRRTDDAAALLTPAQACERAVQVAP